MPATIAVNQKANENVYHLKMVVKENNYFVSLWSITLHKDPKKNIFVPLATSGDRPRSAFTYQRQVHIDYYTAESFMLIIILILVKNCIIISKKLTLFPNAIQGIAMHTHEYINV